MILSNIKLYLQKHRQATLSDLAHHFDIDPEAMRGMLEQWVQKGKVSRSRFESGCKSGCSSCACRADMDVYQWRGDAKHLSAHNR
jgi:putative ferrous iron transport protein C